jgi:hypothetical protein
MVVIEKCTQVNREGIHMRAGKWIAGVVLLAASAGPGTAKLDPAVVSMLEYLSLAVPNPPNVVICHGFSCNYRTEVGFGPADRKELDRLMARGKTSAAAERQGIAEAYAWFERRVAPEAGTATARARTTPNYMRDRSQFDCFDKTSNATNFLALLDHFGLLRHHVIDVPVSRGLLIDFRQHHTTAVIRERASGKTWSVDGWTHANGEKPDIMPMEIWVTQD